MADTADRASELIEERMAQALAGLVAHYRRQRGELPCSAEVLAAIEDWRR